MQTPPLQLSPLVHRLLSLQTLFSYGAPLNTQLPVLASHESTVQALPSLQVFALPVAQTFPLHASPTVQALPSASQAAVLAVWTQPFWASQLSSVHGLLSAQPSLLPTVQTPAWQLSLTVQMLPSASQDLPSLNGLVLHWPVVGAQLVTLHWPSADLSHRTMVFGSTLQLYGTAEVSQNSVPLQRSPSSLTAQSLVWLHAQTLLPDTQVPAAQVSFGVHGLPSSQAPVTSLQLAVALFGRQIWQPPAWVTPVATQLPSMKQEPPPTDQLSALWLGRHARHGVAASTAPSLQQTLPMKHVPGTTVCAQVPPEQVSLVQVTPSSGQGTAFAVCRQALLASQESVVQMLPSSQAATVQATAVTSPAVSSTSAAASAVSDDASPASPSLVATSVPATTSTSATAASWTSTASITATSASATASTSATATSASIESGSASAASTVSAASVPESLPASWESASASSPPASVTSAAASTLSCASATSASGASGASSAASVPASASPIVASASSVACSDAN